jgi:ATP-dependent Clp protease ATP-binding subunit ClpA
VVPKINVYLPDDLAEAVKEMGVPVSAICQRALEASVRRVTAVRQATLGQVPLDDPAGRMAHFTAKSRAAVGLAVRSARASGSDTVGTEHLLAGLLADDTNLAMVVLTSMEIEPAAIGQALAAAGVTAAAAAAAATSAAPTNPDPDSGPGAGAGASGGALRFSGPAANALELAVTEAISLGHNYVGCEHLLLGLASETEGTGGAVLRDLGADARPVRRAVTAALAGYTAISASKQARAQAASQASQPGQANQPNQPSQASQPGQPGAGQMLAMLREAVRREMQPFTERLERLEERLGPEGDQP